MLCRSYLIRVLLACLIISAPSISLGKVVTAKTAKSFYESIGVNTQFWKTSGPYADRYSAVRNKVDQLDVSFVRDGLEKARDRDRIRSIHSDLGVKFLVISMQRNGDGTLSSNKIPQQIGWMESVSNAILAVEGPNEWGKIHPAADNDWVASLKWYQRNLWLEWDASSKLRNKPVLSPSLIFGTGATDAVGRIDWHCDRGSFHVYPLHPESPDVQTQIDDLNKQTPYKKDWITEFGWRTQPGPYPMKNDVQASYVLRGYAEFFRRGFERSSAWTLIDNPIQMGWGLLRDDLSEKDSFKSLKRMISIVKDTTNHSPGSLNYSIDKKGNTVHELLLQKSDGTFLLLLWRPIELWNYHNGTDDQGKRKSFQWVYPKVSINSPYSSMRLRIPQRNTNTVLANHTHIGMGDRLLIIEIKP